MRAQAKAERDKHRQEGAAQADKPGWAPPEEYQALQLTAMEAPLQDALNGPDDAWLGDQHADRPTRFFGPQFGGGPLPEEAARRLQVLDSLEKEGLFKPVEQASDYLQPHVRARLL